MRVYDCVVCLFAFEYDGVADGEDINTVVNGRMKKKRTCKTTTSVVGSWRSR